MCLAVPGVVQEILSPADGASPISRRAKVSFDGVLREVSLAPVPEAKVGDYVLVHVGLALSVIDEKEAQEIFSLLAATTEDSTSETS